jgi:PAS domain S-box-containing protein
MFDVLRKGFQNPSCLVFPTIAGLVSCLLGFAVVVGWYAGSTALVHVHPSFVAMQYNTALGFLLSGIGLAVLGLGRDRLAMALGVVVGAIGGLTLTEYLFETDLGIDQMLSLLRPVAKPSDLARMSPNTALCFTLTAIALAIPGSSVLTRFRETSLNILGSIIVVFAVVALIGQLGNLDTAYSRSGKVGMAVHTASGFVVLGCGFLTLSRHAWAWRIMWPRWLSALTAAIITFLSISLWQEINRQEASIFERGLADNSTLLASAVKSALSTRISSLDRMVERWQALGVDTGGESRREAERTLREYPGLRAVARVDDRRHVRWVALPEGVTGGDAQTIARAVDTVTAAWSGGDWNRRRVQAWPASAPDPGRRDIVVAVPVRFGGRSAGGALGVIDLAELIEGVAPDAHRANYAIALRFDGETVLGEAVSGGRDVSRYAVESEFTLSGHDWRLWVAPKRAPFAIAISHLPDAVMIVGIMAAFLVALTFNHALMTRDTQLIRENESRLNAILDAAADGIYGLDLKGHATFVNKAAANMLGFAADELMGKPMHDVVHHRYPDGTGYPDGDCRITNVLRTGKGCTVDDEVFWRKDNTALPVEYTCRPKVGALGKISGGVVVFRDNSERKRIEAEREQMIATLSRSNAELDSFAHIASHDLKEPLRAIHNHSQFLLEDYADKLDENGSKRLRRLCFLTERMERLISDLLYYSRLGREELSIRPTDLNAVIDDITHTMRDVLDEEHAAISVPQPLPTIDCDGVRVTELFRNLIQNAIKYNDNSAKTVEVGYRDGTEPVFYVKDNGIGIDPEFHEVVFRIFKRLHGEKEYGRGTGAGLTFVKKIVEQHGGRIEIESVRGKGATFFFTLNREKADA